MATSTGADPTGDDCWGAYATNESMQGSLSAVNIYYLDEYRDPFDVGGDIKLRILADLVNEWLAPRELAGQAAGFTQVSQSFKDNLLARSKDSKRLVSRYYTDNVAANRTGTDSARGFQGNDPITFLGLTAPEVEPYYDPSEPPVPYADPELSGPSQILRAGSGEPHDYAVSRMFWRSHVREVCRELRESHGSALITLRSRCIQGGVSGVDVEACTSCTDLVELVTPAGVASADGTTVEMNPSMCERLGEAVTFFAMEHDSASHFKNPPYATGPSMAVTHGSARAWCTGMWEEGARDYPDLWRDMTGVVVRGELDECVGKLEGYLGFSSDYFGTAYSDFDMRNSMYWTEPGTSPWVAAFQEHYESLEECGERPCLSGDRDGYAEELLGEGSRRCYHPSYWHQMLKVQRCGVLQEHRLDQGECARGGVDDFESRWGVEKSQLDVPEAHYVKNLCLKRERVELSFECPGNLTCGSGGYCRADSPETVRY